MTRFVLIFWSHSCVNIWTCVQRSHSSVFEQWWLAMLLYDLGVLRPYMYSLSPQKYRRFIQYTIRFWLWGVYIYPQTLCPQPPLPPWWMIFKIKLFSFFFFLPPSSRIIVCCSQMRKVKFTTRLGSAHAWPQPRTRHQPQNRHTTTIAAALCSAVAPARSSASSCALFRSPFVTRIPRFGAVPR